MLMTLLSYRIGNPRKSLLPLERLKAVGLSHVEINLEPEAEAEEIRSLLAEHDLKAATLTTPCPLNEPDRLFEVFENYCGKARVLGAAILFVSAKPGELAFNAACERLHQLGDIAARYDLRIGIETHPPLCENSEKSAGIMAAIDHPNVGINFDTANVYYYNHDINAVDELRKTLPYVVSVHLKETNGNYHDAAFPEFGKGVVDFPGVFKTLQEANFSGPFTIELEGSALALKDPQSHETHLRNCVQYLRDLGLGCCFA